MYEVLIPYTWQVTPTGYAYTYAVKKWGRICMFGMMHHCVIGRSVYPLVTDHINRDKLDNRRENLRQVTHRQNVLNSNHLDGKPCQTKPEKQNL